MKSKGQFERIADAICGDTMTVDKEFQFDIPAAIEIIDHGIDKRALTPKQQEALMTNQP